MADAPLPMSRLSDSKLSKVLDSNPHTWQRTCSARTCIRAPLCIAHVCVVRDTHYNALSIFHAATGGGTCAYLCTGSTRQHVYICALGGYTSACVYLCTGGVHVSMCVFVHWQHTSACAYLCTGGARQHVCICALGAHVSMCVFVQWGHVAHPLSVLILNCRGGR
jgi:hypothetical protein